MVYSALSVSNYFIRKALAESVPLTPMKLQKLVYIAHGWHMALSSDASSPEPLIKEQVEAWPYGPVIAEIYHTFSRYGRNSITRVESGAFGEEEAVEDDYTKSLLDKVWSEYKHFSAYQLSAMTHESGTPWDDAFNQKKQNQISNELICTYYKEKLNG